VQRSRTRGVEQARSIVQAARRLIEVKGPAFTTHELVREAGIALQTFYRYFPGKDHLLLAVIEDIIDESCRG
jgi:AcrR family transcriptional regulator